MSREQVMAALPELERLAAHAVERGDLPGLSIGVVYRDEVVYLKGFGVRAIERPDLVDADTVFQLASCSKPIASTVVAALVGEGFLTWDSRIVDIDPGFQMHEPYVTAEITVADLFAHRSGLPGTAGGNLEEIGYDRAEILRRLRLVPSSSSFRAGYSYSNSGLTEGTVAAARAAGTNWEDAAERTVFKPLGMTSTSARYRDFVGEANRAALHVRIDGRWVALLERDADPESPAGGVSSSARDMTQWLRLQLAGGMLGGRRVVDEAALARTHQPVIARGVGATADFYALGWAVGDGPRGVTWHHAGAFSQGAQTTVALMPRDQVGIVVLASAFPTGVPDALADVLEESLAGQPPAGSERIALWNGRYQSLFTPAIERSRALYGRVPATATAALPASAYAGTYANDYLGSMRVSEQGGGLRVTLGPQQALSRPLTHFDRDLFTMVLSPELPDVRSAVTFRLGADGKAVSVIVEALDEEGLGTLTRAGE